MIKKYILVFITFITMILILVVFNDNNSYSKADKKEKVIDKKEKSNIPKNDLIKEYNGLVSDNNDVDDNNKTIYTSSQIIKVFFDYNGGIKDIESKEVTYGCEYGTLPFPIKKGHTFDGWYTKRYGGEKVESTSKLLVKENHTLYARYTINSYLITYDYNYQKDNLYKNITNKSSWSLNDFEIITNDDLFNNENVYKFKFNDKNTTLSYNEDVAIKKDKIYTFSVYIKTNKDKNLLIGFENDFVKIKTNSSWQRFTKTFKVSNEEYTNFMFKLDNNSIWNKDDTIEIYGLTLSEGNLNVKEDIKKYNEYLGELDNPKREGYTFDGWFTDYYYKEKINNTTIVNDMDKRYYAKWLPNLYTLKINTNGGIFEDNLSNNIFIQGYGTIKKLDIPKANYKIIYNLNNTGAKNNKNEDIVERPFKGFIDNDNNLILDNIFIFNKDSILTASYEDKVNINLDTITKPDYVCFWNTKSDGSGENYNSGSTININSDINLYANCKRDIKFVRPLNSGYITSEYGYRIHPIDGYKKFHSGIDMSSSDRNIYPIADGIVSKTGSNSSMGNYIIIYHNINGQNYTSAYYHLETNYVKIGQYVNKDTNIGKMGQTGAATGVHLHLTMYKGYLYEESHTMVNPRDYISFPSKLYKSWSDRTTLFN